MKSRKLQLASAICAGMVLAFLIAPVRSVAQVQQSGQNLVNSTVNSTPIGQSSPAAAAVTQLQVTSSPGSLSSQGAWLGFNKATLGETDFFTAPGSGEGGYLWYNTTSFTQLMQLDYTGILSVAHGQFDDAAVSGNNTLTAVQGMNLAWNLTGGNGEGDFVDLYQSGGVGGFNWYNTPTSSSKGTAVMTLNGSSGVLAVPGGISANVTGNVAGNVTGNVSGSSGSSTGNSATATALAAAGSNCGAGAVAYGVAANGNALCGTVHVLGTTISGGGAGICTTAATAYAQCSQTYYLSPDGTASGAVTFASAPAVSCNSSGAIGTNAYLGALVVSGISTTQFTVTLQNGGTSGAEGASSASYLNCTAIHN